MSSEDASRNRRRAQENIRRRCLCGRIITGNLGWWSHINSREEARRKTTHKTWPNGIAHGFGGRA